MVKVTFLVRDEKTDEVLWEGYYRRPISKDGKYRYIVLDNPTGDPIREITVAIKQNS